MTQWVKLIGRTSCDRCGEEAKEFERTDSEWKDKFIVCDCCGLNQFRDGKY